MKSMLIAAMAVVCLIQLADSNRQLRQAEEIPENVKPLVTTGSSNDFFDILMKNLEKVMKEKDLDPLPLPDSGLTFNMPGLIHLSAQFGLVHGKLKNLSHMKRDGNVSVEYKKPSIRASTVISFDDLQMEYDFVAEVMNIGPDAKVITDVKGLRVKTVIEVNIETKKATLKDLQLLSAGSIRVHVRGLFLFDALINAVSNFTTTLFKTMILYFAELMVRPEAERVVNSFDLNSTLN